MPRSSSGPFTPEQLEMSYRLFLDNSPAGIPDPVAPPPETRVLYSALAYRNALCADIVSQYGRSTAALVTSALGGVLASLRREGHAEVMIKVIDAHVIRVFVRATANGPLMHFDFNDNKLDPHVAPAIPR